MAAKPLDKIPLETSALKGCRLPTRNGSRRRGLRRGRRGDVIEVRDGSLYRNGKRITEPYLKDQYINSDWKLVHYVHARYGELARLVEQVDHRHLLAGLEELNLRQREYEQQEHARSQRERHDSPHPP